MADRLCKLMNWEPGTAHKFEIVRQTCSGNAAALSIEKGNQLADRMWELMLEKENLEFELHMGNEESPMVWAWMRGEADCPDDKVLATVARHEIREWEKYRKDGLDVVALQCLDNAIEVLTAMRELV